jgi:hypothetical protein
MATNAATPFQTDFEGKALQKEAFAFWGAPVIKAQKDLGAVKAGELYCPGFDGPTYANGVWDILKVQWPLIADPGTQQIAGTPGICEIDVSKDHRVDQKKPAGGEGARFTVHGVNPAKVTIRLTIWTPEQLRVLNKIFEFIFPKGASQANVIDVSHPSLIPAGIKSLLFTGYTGPSAGNAVRSKSFMLNALEFIKSTPQKVKKKTPVAAIGSINDPKTLPTPGSNTKNVGP